MSSPESQFYRIGSRRHKAHGKVHLEPRGSFAYAFPVSPKVKITQNDAMPLL
jgi:hypothetical protein